MADYSSFRQRLDAVLRTLDVKQVSDFLIAEKQWDEGTPADPEFAMWMMIAGAPTLGELHERARQWLVSHGHEAEANAVAGRGKQQAKTGKQGRPGAGKGQKRGNDLPPFSGPKKDRRSFRGK
ncbi:MAG TPA: hypothetical protein VFU49_19260 [Ktedonobacteraceae bacterium]|nr:hypothetical protein [Ktedonobacteraceae bacterium]